MKKNVKTLILSMSLLVASSLLVGCKSSNNDKVEEDKDSGLPTLRVATMPFITSLPVKYIIENKLDEKEGFKIKETMFATGAPMNEALAADEWDVGGMGAAAVTGVANYDMMIIGEILESTDGLAVFTKPDDPMAKIKGENPSFPKVLGDKKTVKGKTIALPVGTAQHFTALKWLEKIGLKSTDVNIVNMDTAQAYQALQAGEAQAAALNVPTFFTAEKDGMVQTGNLADLGTRYVDMIVANKKSLEKKKDMIKKYVNLVLETNEKLNEDTNASAKFMSEWLTSVGQDTTVEEAQSDIDRAHFLTKSDFSNREIGKFAKELGEFYVDQGQLEKDVKDKLESNIVNDYIN